MQKSKNVLFGALIVIDEKQHVCKIIIDGGFVMDNRKCNGWREINHATVA